MVARFINLEGGRITTIPRPQLLPPAAPVFPRRGLLPIARVSFRAIELFDTDEVCSASYPSLDGHQETPL